MGMKLVHSWCECAPCHQAECQCCDDACFEAAVAEFDKLPVACHEAA